MVKALFPIGKTQWAKWNDDQRTAFNEACEAGVPFSEAVQAANQMQPKKKKGLFGVLGDVVGAVADVAEIAAPVVAAATPVLAVAETVAKVTQKKAK